MNTTLPSNSAPLDEDLAEQARPGHGVPSQDPDPEAQVALEPEEAEREAKSVMAGGGMVGGAAIGAGIGAAVGVLVGGTVGAVAGAVGAAAAGTIMNPGDASSADPVVEESAPAHTAVARGAKR
ncbi:MAG TPA: hypothetical protein VHQ87_04820 [Rhizobacter sp.]|nr:hypothetical protein [Rhizobacter sp.]